MGGEVTGARAFRGIIDDGANGAQDMIVIGFRDLVAGTIPVRQQEGGMMTRSNTSPRAVVRNCFSSISWASSSSPANSAGTG